MSHTIPNLVEETVYYFRVQARNRKGNGPQSATVAFRTGSRASGRLGTPIDIGAALDGSLGGARSRDGPGGGGGGGLGIPLAYVVAIGVGCALLVVCIFAGVYFVTKRGLERRKESERHKGYVLVFEVLNTRAFDTCGLRCCWDGRFQI
jgi:hypothetical protein